MYNFGFPELNIGVKIQAIILFRQAAPDYWHTAATMFFWGESFSSLQAKAVADMFFSHWDSFTAFLFFVQIRKKEAVLN